MKRFCIIAYLSWLKLPEPGRASKVFFPGRWTRSAGGPRPQRAKGKGIPRNSQRLTPAASAAGRDGPRSAVGAASLLFGLNRFEFPHFLVQLAGERFAVVARGGHFCENFL